MAFASIRPKWGVAFGARPRHGRGHHPGSPQVLRTAYGKGAHIPGRRIAHTRLTKPTARVGDPEAQVWLEDLRGPGDQKDFDTARVWP
jgi:hypothetical protein